MVAHHQNTHDLKFKVPFVPYIPALSILCNIELMVHLSVLTWMRFFVWMTLGMLIYFLYGIHHSKEGSLCTSYSMLITSNEATKNCWGSTARTALDKIAESVGVASSSGSNHATDDDKVPIVDDEDET